MPTVRTRKQTNYGYPNPSANQAQEPIVADRAPTTNDGAEIGTIWIDRSADDFRILCDNTSGSFTWTGVSGGATTLTSLTVNPGNLVVTAGDLTVSAGTTTVGALVAGATTITGNVGITGDLTVTGDFDVTDTAAISLTSTSDTDPAIFLHANGGTNEVIRLRSNQGTGVDSIDILSDVGGVTISAGIASDDAINLEATNGGIDLDAATQISIASLENAADAIVINASAGGLDILAAGAAGEDIDILNTAGSINIIGGESITDAVNITASGAAGGVNIGSGSNGVNINDSVNEPVNINTGTSTGALTLGNAAAGAMTIITGAGIDVDAATASSYTVTGANEDLTLAAIGGSLKLNATEDVAAAVEVIANGGTSETIVLNAQQGTGVASINLQSDAGGITLTSNVASDDGINLNAIAGGVDIDGALQVNIASSEAASDAITLSASNAAGGIVVDGGGIVSMVPDTASVASPTASSTQNFRVLTTTFTGFTTAAAASQDFTIVSSDILATSGLFVQVANLDASTNAALMTLDGVTQSAGQIVVSTTNNGAGALGAGDNVLISVWVIS